MRTRFGTILLVVLSLAVAAGSVVYLISFFVHASNMLAHPFPVDYGEGPLLAQVQQLRAGVPVWKLYSDPSVAPYLIVNYPPLYPMATAMLSMVTGNSVIAGRLLSLLATAGCVSAIVFLITRVSRSVILAIGISLLFVSIPVVREWSAFMRVDMLGVCLGLWGLAVLVSRRPVTAGGLLLLSLYTKPSLIAAPLAAVVYLIMMVVQSYRDRLRSASANLDPDFPPDIPMDTIRLLRHGLLLLVVLLIGGGGLFGLLHAASDGWFGFHVIVANANRWDAHLALQFWQEQVQLRWPLMLAAALSLAVAMYRKPAGSYTLPALYTLAGIITAAGVGKVGAYANYFLEMYAGLIWLVGAGLASLWNPTDTPREIPVSDNEGVLHALDAPPLSGIARFVTTHSLLIAGTVQVLLIASMVFYLPMWSPTRLMRAGILEPNPPKLAYAMRRDLIREADVLAALERTERVLHQQVKDAGEVVLTDTPGVVTQAGVVSRIQAFEHRQLYDQGAWSQQDVLRQLANGKIDLAVIHYLGNWLTPQMVAMLEHRYAQDGSLATFDLFRPVHPGTFRPIDLTCEQGLTVRSYALAATNPSLPTGVAASGNVVVVTLEWVRTEPQDTTTATDEHSDTVVVLQLRDDEGGVVVESRRVLLYGALPPADWLPDEPMQHMQPLQLPVDLPDRSYALVVGLSNSGDSDSDSEATPALCVPQPSERVRSASSPVPSSESSSSMHLASTSLAFPDSQNQIDSDAEASDDSLHTSAIQIQVVAQGRSYFKQTGYSVPAPFTRAWNVGGGITQIGAPLTPAVPFSWGVLQCFEYTCLELRDGVVAQRPLGEWLYLAETPRSVLCLGQNEYVSLEVCPDFRHVWYRHGDVALGQPISGEIERNGLIVQWTSYARLERSPDGSYEGLGRLGDDVQRLSPGMRYRWPGQ